VKLRLAILKSEGLPRRGRATAGANHRR
jgi:hypothetical protein